MCIGPKARLYYLENPNNLITNQCIELQKFRPGRATPYTNLARSTICNRLCMAVPIKMNTAPIPEHRSRRNLMAAKAAPIKRIKTDLAQSIRRFQISSREKISSLE